jgi:hypothetical protein
MNVYTGWGVPDIQGPTEDLPTEHLRVRGPSGRSDVRYGGIGVAVLLLVAAGSFWLSGTSRGDVTLQSLGIAFVAVAAGVMVAAIYLSRAD